MYAKLTVFARYVFTGINSKVIFLKRNLVFAFVSNALDNRIILLLSTVIRHSLVNVFCCTIGYIFTYVISFNLHFVLSDGN